MTGVPPRPSSGGAPHLKQVIPTARAILWNPSGRRNPGGRYPLFIEQKAVDALHVTLENWPRENSREKNNEEHSNG